ncbi:MAG: pre-peptidase C-terminal domain-containing protein [Deltaproteobacteria bacterium]|nr:pre-peptidase C-terminal domain-containing protein [Deltaproteobacteria bacterium]
MRAWKLVWTLVFLMTTACGGGGTEEPTPPECQVDSCSGNGTCSVVGMELACECDAGYLGSTCDACAAGFQDNDENGTCEADCFDYACAAHSICDDSSGTARCACDAGYQDHDGDDLCLADCVTADLNCSEHGSCEDTSGTAVCVCDVAYSGPQCTACATGYQDLNGDGACMPDCATAALSCDGYSHCEDSTGEALCACDEGYQGENCDTCAPGYIDPEGDGTCEEGGTGLSCDSPLVLDPSLGSLTGNSTAASNQQEGTCSSADGHELVYVFTLAQNMRVEFWTSGSFDTVLYLRSNCDSSASEVACNDDDQGTDSRIQADLGPGTYYVFVDGYGADDHGSFSLMFDFECGAGLLFDAATGTCVDNPCEPNPCSDLNKNACEVNTADYSTTCSCNVGYIDDGAGGCEEDPNANQWALFVYLNGDNDLEDYAHSDLAEMVSAGGSDAMVHVVLLMDTWDGPANIYYVTDQGTQTVESWGEVDMGDWATLRDFGVWAVQHYPAQKVGLIMWDHGDGWRSPDSGSSLLKGFSLDFTSGESEISIANGDYAQAMSAITSALGRKLDLVGFDACVMGTWEIAAATEPYADILVASSESEPAAGWAYHGFLPDLKANPYMDAATLGEAIVQSYHDDASMNATLSVTDLTTMDDLVTAISNLADAMMADSSAYNRVEQARTASTDFGWDPDTRDLGEFASRLANTSGVSAAVTQAATALVNQIDITVIFHLANSGYTSTHGLSTYFPGHGFESAYRDSGAIWSSQSTWDEFLLDYN